MLAFLFRTVPRLRLIPGLPFLFDTVLLGHTALFHSDRLTALHEIEKSVLAWPGVTTKIHRFGGTEFLWGRREIGHLHGSGLLDIPFTKALRDQIITAGAARPHHIFSQSSWVSFYIRGTDDISPAIDLLRLNYERWDNLDREQV